MKIRLIYPRFMKFLEANQKIDKLLKKHKVGNYTMPPSLALPILASLTPEDIEVELTDDNIGEPINYEEHVDLVVISFFTPQAQRAYEIADEFRKCGKKVAVGGIHPTAMPEEAIKHADVVCIGEAENTWHLVIQDLRCHTLKKFYRSSEVFNLEKCKIPRRDVFNKDKYIWSAHLVQTTRGCPAKCDNCPLPLKEGEVIRYRPIVDVVEDIKSMPYDEFYIIDDSLLLPGRRQEKYLLELMEQTKQMDISIFLPSTMMMAKNKNTAEKEHFFYKLKEGGVSSLYTVFGYERISRDLFNKEKCSSKVWQEAVELVKIVNASGIHFFGSFGIGFDYQDESVADKILKFCLDANIDLAEFYINTPYPGTPFGDQVVREERLLNRDYLLWNHANVVFKPRFFTVNSLQNAYFYLWEKFYENKEEKNTLKSFNINYDIVEHI